MSQLIASSKGKGGRCYNVRIDRVVKRFYKFSDSSKVQVANGEITVEGMLIKGDTFEEYLSSLVQLLNSARDNPFFPESIGKQLLRELDDIPFHDPTILSVLREISATIKFREVKCATPVKFHSNPTVGKLPTFTSPYTAPDVLLVAVECNGRYPQFNYSFLIGMHTKFGIPICHVGGSSASNYLDSVQKLENNQLCPAGPWAPHIHLALQMLTYRWGVSEVVLKFNANMDYIIPMLNKDTSIGYVVDNFLEFIDGKFQPTTRVKKKDVALLVIEGFNDWVENLRIWIDNGKQGDPPLCSVLDLEMLKHEVLWNVDNLEDEDVTVDDMKKTLKKLRLFYMASIMDYILSVMCFKPMNETIRFYESAIGIKVGKGGLQKMWKILSGQQLTIKQEEIIEKWKALDVDLTDLQYGQGDWKSYDQTLLAIVLAFVCYLPHPFMVPDEEEGMTEELFKEMFVQFVVSNVQKVMHVYAHGTQEVFGCMFSGKYITSIGDTIYQMLLKMVYFMAVIEKYPDDQLLMDMVEHGFYRFFFYGDDHNASWPRVANKFTLYGEETVFEDFIKFCETEFGMISKRKELKIYDHAYGERYFTLTEGVYVEDLGEAVESPVFLKNTVAYVYVRNALDQDYQLIDALPYRRTNELVCKMTKTLNSSANPKSHMMALCSIASLSVGNLEAYDMARVMYESLRLKFGKLTLEEETYFVDNLRGENSLFRAAQIGGFPDYAQLVCDQRSGASSDGFVPKDFSGNKALESSLYSTSGKGNVQAHVETEYSRRVGYYEDFFAEGEYDDYNDDSTSDEFHDNSYF